MVSQRPNVLYIPTTGTPNVEDCDLYYCENTCVYVYSFLSGNVVLASTSGGGVSWTFTWSANVQRPLIGPTCIWSANAPSTTVTKVSGPTSMTSGTCYTQCTDIAHPYGPGWYCMVTGVLGNPYPTTFATFDIKWFISYDGSKCADNTYVTGDVLGLTITGGNGMNLTLTSDNGVVIS